MTNILFYIINIPFIVINNVDIEYIKFTRKRTSIDILDLLGLTGGGGEDAGVRRGRRGTATARGQGGTAGSVLGVLK